MRCAAQRSAHHVCVVNNNCVRSAQASQRLSERPSRDDVPVAPRLAATPAGARARPRALAAALALLLLLLLVAAPRG